MFLADHTVSHFVDNDIKILFSDDLFNSDQQNCELLNEKRVAGRARAIAVFNSSSSSAFPS